MPYTAIVSPFERLAARTAAQADESTRIAASWLREHKLETALPNAPKLTSGDVVVQTRELAKA